MNKAEQLVKLLIEKKYTVSFAESCTGGKMAARIVDVPDASKVLNASIVTYANEAKMKYANVSKDTLKQYGAVSENTAREMAEGVAKANNADEIIPKMLLTATLPVPTSLLPVKQIGGQVMYAIWRQTGY